MKLLTKAMQADISRQMCFKSRDIDMCMINALDGSMTKDYLLDCLMFYQNRDGGFAGGLHIDNYNTNTSVYQIYEAFRLLDMLDFDSNCELDLFETIVNKACNYLYNREPMKDGKWNPNTITNNDFAHGQDFTYNDENMAKFGYHPTAAILGYTLILIKPTKAYYKKALKYAAEMINIIKEKNDFTKYELISFNSFLNSIKKANLFPEAYEIITKKLVEYAEKVISLDFNDINSIKPLDAALYISSEKLDAAKNQQLDHIIDSIAPHGLWNHNSTWGYDKYAEEDSAMLKWIGAETVNNYYLLKKFERIE
ncbi:MAG: hypothetical protein ACI35S_03120 [Anaeroplasma sp.]